MNEINRLLSNNRYNQSSVKEYKNALNNRSDFEADYDRIIFSSSFRNLQDKTQVFPLPDETFVHNRLTHSLEVSSVGKSLGKLAGEFILKSFPNENKNITPLDFGNAVAASCLCHDIGNPPFGHSGEKAISEFFAFGTGKRFQNMVTPSEWNDLIDFEGNAMGFHLLNNFAEGAPGGLRLTAATLASFIKYPRFSGDENKSNFAWHKKYGILQADKTFFYQTVEPLLLKKNETYVRHPLAFLMEAADDICYTIIDYEDGIRLGLIPFTEGESILKTIAKNGLYEPLYNSLESENEKISYLRALCINELTMSCVNTFTTKYEEINNGEYNQALIDDYINADIIKLIKNRSIEDIYQATPVLKMEALGYEVIHYLLEHFTLFIDNKQMKAYNYKRLIPKQYLKENVTVYEKLIAICEYISGMTDRKAISIYKSLRGL